MIIRIVSTLLILVCIPIFAAMWIFFSTPNAQKIQDCIVTHHYQVSLCPGSKNYVTLSNVSQFAKDLILIAEDSSFYSHNGFDLHELKLSLDKNLALSKFARGGSTITQQLAKNVFLPFEKSIFRKIREALIARELESILTKDQILERYLNVIEFGPNIYGIKSASFHYFKKPPSDLNLLESAFLVYLVPNPKVHSRVYSGGQLTAYSRYRLRDLCYRMYRFHKISESQYVAVKALLEEFPWAGLTSEQIAMLNTPQESADTTASDSIELPETDSELVPVEAPPIEESEAPPVVEAILETTPETTTEITPEAEPPIKPAVDDFEDPDDQKEL